MKGIKQKNNKANYQEKDSYDHTEKEEEGKENPFLKKQEKNRGKQHHDQISLEKENNRAYQKSKK